MQKLSAMPVLRRIELLEKYLLTLPQTDTPVAHDFSDGLYARTMFIPEGTLAVGAVHSSESFLFVRYGEATIWTEDSETRIHVGMMIKGKVGVKRVAYAHMDTLFTTVHANPNNEKDPDKLWSLYTVPSGVMLDAEELKLLEVAL
jgi:mannose-6-phosphate isomerase-like protein (cupin superfamily)